MMRNEPRNRAFRGAVLAACVAALIVVAHGSGLGGPEMDGQALQKAYMGPGAGIAAVGALIGLVWIVINVIVGLVWYPVRRFRQWRRERQAQSKS